MTKLKEFIVEDFHMKDYFLDIKVTGLTNEVFISQSKYIGDLLKETGILCCRPTNSSIKTNHKLLSNVGKSVGIGRYQRLV